MTRLVALLRGINVGGHKKVPMAELREVAEGLGWSGVKTYVQSGNVVFGAPRGSPDALAAKLSGAVEAAFGFPVAVVVRSRDELADVVAANPLGDLATDPARHHVLFLDAAPDPSAVERIQPGEFAPDAFVLRGRELFLWTPAGVRDSRLAKALSDKRLGVTSTARNWRTVERLLAMAGEDG